jgi:hypothetical protein
VNRPVPTTTPLPERRPAARPGSVGPLWLRIDLALDTLRWPRVYLRRRLRALGVPRAQLWRLMRAAYRHATGRVIAVYIALIPLSVHLQGHWMSPLEVTQILFSAAAVAAVAAVLLAGGLRPRTRLRIAALRTAELALLLRPVAPEGMPDVPATLHRRLRRDPGRRQRTVATTAWTLTRDTARVNGAPFHAGELGHVLLWYAANPRDPRRGPILSGCLIEFIAAVTDPDQPIPHPEFTPAARFPILSPRARFLQSLRATASGALVTGVLVAVVSAALKALTS